ncbi:MAG: PilZ domain-containing protein [Deltaproteobacteria bacterium]|nr:PilZ domain-containing protein [Deltaproteobacteria bacterium]
MTAFAQVERRHTPRQLVFMGAECRLGGAALTGVIRDQSNGGVFFTPTQDGDIILKKVQLSFEPELGDFVLLTYADENILMRKPATVCWFGYSHEHSCEGLGLAFVED